MSRGDRPGALTLVPLLGVPEVTAGDDVAGLLLAALDDGGHGLLDGDILVVSSKILSKAGGLRAAASRREELVLAEATRVVAERDTPGGITRVVESHAGPVLAAAGIDASNVGDLDDASTVLLLPRDPDARARELRDALMARRGPARIGVVVSDTAGRPWRVGQVDIAIGAAGLNVLDDLRGGVDADGRPLAVTARAVGDEIAAAADLVKEKSAGVPAALIRGLDRHVDRDGEGATGGGARGLVRTGPGDWFALGHREAVRAALGVPPASEVAARVGIPAVGEEDHGTRVARALAVALVDDGPAGTPGVRPRLEPGRVRLHGDDPFVLGMAVARLVTALRGEGLSAGPAPRDPGAPGEAVVDVDGDIVEAAAPR